MQLSHDRYRVSDVEDHQRFIDVHFKITAGAAEADRDVIGHHLHGDHRQRFALGRVNLARHDGGAWLVLWDLQFAKSGTRAAGHQPDVIGDLVERNSQRAHRSGQLNQCIVSTLDRVLIRSGDKGQSGELGNLGS